MPKLNFFALKRATGRAYTGQFTDPAYPDDPVDLTVTYQPGIEFDERQEELLTEYRARYLTGRGEPGTPGFIGPAPLPPLSDGTPPPLTEGLCVYLSYLTAMRAGAPGDAEPYSFEQLAAAAATYPVAFKQIVAWLNGIVAGAQPPNAAGGGSASSWPPQETATPPATPTSSPA